MNISKQQLKEIQKKIGYIFINQDLLIQAFTRSSYAKQFGCNSNEILEFIGDEVLDFYVTKIIADHFGFMKSQSDDFDENDMDEYCIAFNKTESDFTDLKKEIVKNETLAKRIDNLEFFDYILLGDSDLDNPNFKNNLVKVKADLFESILGAIAIDCNWNQKELQDSVESMLNIDDFLDNVDCEEDKIDDLNFENAINILKELSEHEVCSIPEYIQSNEQVALDNGREMWKCTCYVKSWGISKDAYATSKKLAKKYAAYLVLCERYQIDNKYKQ